MLVRYWKGEREITVVSYGPLVSLENAKGTTLRTRYFKVSGVSFQPDRV